MKALRAANRNARRGAAVVYVALSVSVIMGMAALAIDLGMVYTAKSELQRAADSAALASAGHLIWGGTEDWEDDMLASANALTYVNEVLGDGVGVSASDVEFGRAVPGDTAKWEFQSGQPPYDALRITLRRSEGSSAGPINSIFAKFWGHESTDVVVRASAMLIPRDVAVVIDLSNSMNYDSQLAYWDRDDGGYANTRDVWSALDGPEADRPYLPLDETQSQYANDTGPTLGFMNQWGGALIPGTYSPNSDAGLVYIPRGALCSSAKVIADLTAAGYSADERSILLNGTGVDSTSSGSSGRTHWLGRVAVCLGLAEWKSGRPGGKYTSGGDGDNRVDAGELVWDSYPSWRQGGWSWDDYIYRIGEYSEYTSGIKSEFRYRYGPKTFTDYLLRLYPRHFEHNNNLWQTPQQPLRAVKDALQVFIDTVSEFDALDHMSLEIFATTARHEVDLTSDIQNVADTLYLRQSAHYDNNTAIAAGMLKAMTELQGPRGRANASKMMVLMSDGVPNANEDGVTVSSSTAQQNCLERAQDAMEAGITIHTVSVGYEADVPLMMEIAAIGRGEHFHAAGSPEEYTEELKDVFRKIGGKHRVALIE